MTERQQGLLRESADGKGGGGSDIFMPQSTALFTDLYHIDAAYMAWKQHHHGMATFDLYTRSNPFNGGFMLVAGLEPALDYLARFRYEDEQLGFLEKTKHYDPRFLDYLREMRFTGEILGMAEGEIAFPNEPILRVTAPFPEAMIIESGLLRAIGVSTLIATKAARLTLAAHGALISDFAFRRAHAPHTATRAGYIGGCDSTSFVAAAMEYGIPAAGTIPHAFVQSYASEIEAFRAVARSLPTYSLLLDTYDVEQGIENAITVATDEEQRSGNRMVAVRLDSGDLAADSVMVRARLDVAGLDEVQVLVSGDIDEYRITEILGSGAPVDGFGVGGNLGVGLGAADHGSSGGVLGAVYKLVWFGDGSDANPSRIKLAGGKSTWPGRKLVYRFGAFDHDLVQLESEPVPVGGRALLQPIVSDGARVVPDETIQVIRQRAMAALDALPEHLRELNNGSPYAVERSAGLLALREETAKRYSGDSRTAQ
jgi:nicotinate phosphoribosyltransferase